MDIQQPTFGVVLFAAQEATGNTVTGRGKGDENHFALMASEALSTKSQGLDG
ncbi:hypothetical protein [Desulfuromonas sp. CSMB_57]|uniref:hypothetical protein n=1 Tax=Desulfuromonas sp. CSMB_57 TaxID=2807629 RepID=UPI0020BD6DDB|nr:hypothetical protein [Desulfuromonas sp. CSMB_57]